MSYSQRSAASMQGDRHIGQFDLPCFCIFTKHLAWELIPFMIARPGAYLTQKRCPHERRIGLKAMLMHITHA